MKTFFAGLLFSFFAMAQTPTHFVKLMWTDTTNPTGTNYNVYKVTGVCPAAAPTLGNMGTFVKVNSSPLATMLYQDTAVTVGSQYCYAVTAITASGTNESAPAAPVVTVPIPSTLPPGGVIIIIQ